MGSERNNRISNSVIQDQYKTYGSAWCEYCGKEVYLDVPVTAHNRVIGDHRTPMSRGGLNIESNIAIACRVCDQIKGPLTKEEFLPVMNDVYQRKKLINQVLYQMGKVSKLTDFLNRGAVCQDRNIARRNSLQDRLVDPDPNCSHCDGKGILRKKGRLFHYCRCSVLPKENQN